MQLPTFPPTNSPFLPLGVPQSPPALVGKLNPLYAHHPRTYVDTVVTHKWNDRLTQAMETICIIDTDVVQTNGNCAPRGELVRRRELVPLHL